MKGKRGSRIGLANRYAAWAARKATPSSGFTTPPEPRSIGSYARGKQLLNGNLLLAGTYLEAPGQSLWDTKTKDQAFNAEAQGFGWLDDLAALGTPQAIALAHSWTKEWINRYGRGKGPGWLAQTTGRRIIRWCHHSLMLISGQDLEFQNAYFASLAQQSDFLSHRAQTAPSGFAKIEALTGLLYAGLFLRDKAQFIAPAIAALEQECQATIDDQGAIASRNPEELLEILTLLTWALQAMAQNSYPLPQFLTHSIDLIAPVLRVLRHSDGGLARFHGGGSGAEGRLDQTLASSAAVRPVGHLHTTMGYWRLSGGRSSLIMDAANPPAGDAALTAHASIGAFELTSGRRPLIVNCGSGVPFGPEWRLAGRATQSHSALSLTGFSSSRFGQQTKDERLTDCANVTLHKEFQGDGALVQLSHDGWVATHGLSARRDVHLSADGRRITGVDQLLASTEAEKKRFSDQVVRSSNSGIAFCVRFHLHPDVDATLDMGGTAISMQLRSGEIWVLRHDGQGQLTLEPSAYLEKGRLKPRPSRQIVLSCNACDFDTSISWTLAKAQDTPLAIRDLDCDTVVPI